MKINKLKIISAIFIFITTISIFSCATSNDSSTKENEAPFTEGWYINSTTVDNTTQNYYIEFDTSKKISRIGNDEKEFTGLILDTYKNNKDFSFDSLCKAAGTYKNSIVKFEKCPENKLPEWVNKKDSNENQNGESGISEGNNDNETTDDNDIDNEEENEKTAYDYLSVFRNLLSKQQSFYHKGLGKVWDSEFEQYFSKNLIDTIYFNGVHSIEYDENNVPYYPTNITFNNNTEETIQQFEYAKILENNNSYSQVCIENARIYFYESGTYNDTLAFLIKYNSIDYSFNEYGWVTTLPYIELDLELGYDETVEELGVFIFHDSSGGYGQIYQLDYPN